MQATTKPPIQRGIQAFNSLLFDISPTPTKEEYNGRSPQLIANRDGFLIHRYYYKARVQRKLYADVLQELENEVYISKAQIQKIISQKLQQVYDLKDKKPDATYFKKVYPHIVW